MIGTRDVRWSKFVGTVWEILVLAWGCHGRWLGIGVASVPVSLFGEDLMLSPWADCLVSTNELIGEDSLDDH